MIWIITVQRPGDAKPTCWYFDEQSEWNTVCNSLKTMGIKYTSRDDYITDAEEFRSWWKHEGEPRG